jgi:uncharacterized protein YciI
MADQSKEVSVPRLFVVMLARGPAWNWSEPLDGQAEWRPHADFMNRLHAEGFVLLAGPLEGASDVLQIVRADSPEQIAVRLGDDPWARDGLLWVVRIAPWDLRIGEVS